MKKYRVLKNDWFVDEGEILEFKKEHEYLKDVWYMKKEVECKTGKEVLEFALYKDFLEEIKE